VITFTRMKPPLTYKEAGVDLEAADRFVELLKGLSSRTHKPWVLHGVGGFSSLVSIPPGFRRPLLAAATDGVGTKLKVAFAMDRYDTVGVDLVAMCLNDLLTIGARPLFFLDYFATGKLAPERDRALMEGIVRGCQEADCPLVGGETAEMPGFYLEGEFDLAGFAVGVVEEERVVDGRGIRPGDRIVGLASRGLHSNGFSLVRRALLEGMGLELEQWIEELGRPLGEELLEPTKIYVRTVLGLLEEFPVKGMAHITGGGLPGNISRVLPEGCKAVIDRGSWTPQPIFGLIQRAGVPEEEMWRTFNMGVGFVMICDGDVAQGLVEEASRRGEEAFLMGEVREGKGVVLEG